MSRRAFLQDRRNQVETLREIAAGLEKPEEEEPSRGKRSGQGGEKEGA